jgi:membrane-associated phospholipid phosphatase
MSSEELVSSASHPGPNRQLALHTALLLLACTVLAALCYWFVDWRVARWVHDEQLGQNFPWLKWPTYLSWWIEIAALVIICLLALWRAFGTWQRWQKVLLAAALSVTVASGIAEQVKVVFGRPWPQTWRHDNSSYIDNGDYDFRWFHGSDDYGSFPSGHTTVICAAMSVVWIAWPRIRWLAALTVLAVVVGLVSNNYHFVGDIVAGAFLGSIVGAWSARLLGVAAR